MVIRLDENYNAMTSTALLGYIGETNARPVSVEGMEIDGADRYVMTIDYGDGVTYEVDITGGQWTPTAEILRSAQTVSCQIAAKKLSGDEYILVKKSRIFRLRIGAAIGDTAIPSPSVAADALDRIDAIGRQTHADMQTAVTAAETATTAAENAEKSATTAGVSADTATQAASRAETAKTAAETSATQADTARQGAETARQQAVTAQNTAKISAAQAATSAQQTTADKTITAGYAKTAKTNADSTAADRQAVQTLAEQVTADKTITAGYAKTAKTNADSTAADRQAVQTLAEQVTADKATVADHAAQVAEDRTAAETAAQTAQSVADSLPDDYTTAVGKIAENTAEISAVKLTDKELQRRVNALYDLGNGITHKFETDTDTAYAKAVPTGAKLMSVKSVGGRSIVFNQLVDSNIVIGETTRYSFNGQHLTTNITDSLSLSDDLCTLPTIPVGHKVLLKIKFIAGNVGNKEVTIGGYYKTANISWQCKIDLPRNTELAGKTLIAMDTTTDTAESIRFFLYNATIPLLTNIDCYINYYDLTTMFGSGNEPVNVEEFEKMFPADYYPYNAGEIVSTGTESIVEQGANLYYGTDMLKVGSDDYEYIANSYRCKSIKLKPNTTYTLSFNSDKTSEIILLMNVTTVVNAGQYFDFRKASHTQTYTTGDDGCLYVGVYAGNGNVASADVVKRLSECKIMISEGDTPTAYAPFHRNVYQIPEAIKALPGYGVEGNAVDYEAKTYTQNNTVDGTEVKALDTPIVTDISTLIPDDFLRNIEVEAGGSVTFKNSNDNYRIPVPSEEEYVVKLSEVGGNV